MKTKVRATIPLCLIFSLLLLAAFVRRDDDPLAKLVAGLQKWTDSIPQEKIYLHTDKPYYAVGDTIWFKGYLTIGSRHQLSALSGAVYVDLINQNDSLIQQLKLPVTSGMVIGDFILKDDYRQGNYRLRAYTQWMRNAGEDFFYDHTFVVGDVAGNDVVGKAEFVYKTDNGKSKLKAILNYTNETGANLANQAIRYEIRRKNKPIWQQNSNTDAAGNLIIDIPDNAQKNPAGVTIRTYIKKGKNTIIRDFPFNAAQSQSDVQFFPESGDLVNGLSSHVAFKAVGIDGSGIDLKGSVTDNDNNIIAKIETLHAGMGSFILKPEAGKTYNANITFKDGSAKTIALPKAKDQGYVLSVFQPNNDSLLVRIQASAAMMQSNVYLIAHTNGEGVSSSPVTIEKPITSMWLDKKAFPSGIAQFTLFNKAGDPLNERLAFVRNNDHLSLNIKTTKTTYSSKERVMVDLDAKDSKGQPTFGNFSVSVIDEGKMPFDENKESTIFSNLLLTSDLKGYVEQPNYYFVKENDETDKALDNLMLTQGYRRFTWKELNNITDTKPKFPVEGLGVSISGTVTTLTHKILPGAKVELVSLRARVAKSTTTDDKGRFSFDGIFMTDSIKFAVQARMGKSDHAILTLDTLPKIRINSNVNLPDASTNIAGSLKDYLKSAQNEDDIYEKMGMLEKVHRLRQVEIRAKGKKVSESDIAPQGMFKINEGSADQVINVDQEEASHYVTLADYLQSRMQGIRIGTGASGSTLELLQNNSSFSSSFRNAKQPISLYLNGRKVDGDELSRVLDSEYAPEDIAKIETVIANQAMINFLGGPGVLILTRLGVSRKTTYDPSIANVSPKGFNRVREFYTPRYDRRGVDLSQPDTRSTVYWNPYLKTDATGKTSFNFFNADGPGNYKVVVEGINAEGQLGRQVYRYTVDGSKIFAATSPNIEASAATATIGRYNKRMPAEKIYVQFDRNNYNINDTLWFKTYVVNGTDLTPSKNDELLHIEFNDDSLATVRQVSVRIKDGVGWGQIPLSDKMFHEGAYSFRAYTNWMQNFGTDGFFTRRLYLGKAGSQSLLVNTNASISRVQEKDKVKERLDISLKLKKTDKAASPVALKPVEVMVYEIKKEKIAPQTWLHKEKLQTGVDGSLNLSALLNDKLNTKRLRISIKSLVKEDKGLELQSPVKIIRDQNIDLQFLPEGGKLVAGLKSTVGFKAIGEDGLGTSVSGDIYTASGTKVTSFSTLHNGMGSFEFTPAAGEVYIARLTKPADKIYKLPVIYAQGTVMHIINAENDDNIKVTLSGTKSLGTDTACYLTASSKGAVIYSHLIKAGEPDLVIAKSLFPTGIAHFTLFKGMKPVNERMAFIDHKDQFNIRISSNKNQYHTRDSVGLNIQVKDKNGAPVQGNFALAVTDDSQTTPDSLDNYGIAAGLLLNAELKGRVESPGYYINRKDPYAWQALDNLLLTQGWVGYDWKTIFSPPADPKFLIEKDTRIIGKANTFGNKPLVGVPIVLTSKKPSLFITTVSDANGNWEFKDLPPTDSAAYFLQVNNAKGGPLISAQPGIVKFVPPGIPSTDNDPITPWYVNSDTTLVNQALHDKNNPGYFKAEGTLLKQVEIRNKKIIKGSYYSGPSNLILDEEDLRQSGQTNLYDVLRTKVPGFHVVLEMRERFHKNEVVMKIGQEDFVDQLWLDAYLLVKHGISLTTTANSPDPHEVDNMINMLKGYPIADLKGVQVLLSRSIPMLPYIKEYYYAKIFVDTKQGLGSFTLFNKPGIDGYTPMPVLSAQEFYSPKYKADDNIDKPDYRPTLFWKPNITTDVNGQAKVSFYTSDEKGKYTVKIAGMDDEGGLGDGTFKINGANTDKPADQTEKPADNKTASPALPKKAAVKVPAADGDLKRITSPLDSLNKRMPTEKVFLHLDKPYYNIGDTLWFKSYVVKGADFSPSKISGILYVELDDDSAEVVRRVSLRLKDGEAWAQIPLPKKIFHEGGYTLRAYTNWMQNFGESAYFTQRFYLGVPAQSSWLVNADASVDRVAGKDQLNVSMKLKHPNKLLSPVALKKVEVKIYDEWHYLYKEDLMTGIDGSLQFSHKLDSLADSRRVRVQITSLDKADGRKIIQVPLTISRSQNIDLQFLPEGGKLVAGLKSVVGFKAVGEDGNGVSVSGSLYDSKGIKITDFEALHNGMGSFEFTPKANELYTAKLAQPKGYNKAVALPKAAAQGTVMHVVNNEQSEDLQVSLSGLNSLATDSACYLIVTSRGLTCYSQKVNPDKTELKIAKKLFPTGIARLTLFSGIRPLNERAVFIDNHDGLEVKTASNKKTYGIRDSVSLNIEVKDKDGFPVKGNFSLAVTDDSQVRADSLGNNGITAGLLLNADLKGHVENPGYYIIRKDKQAWQALDNLMLTQGWTGYDWQDVFAPAKSPAFAAEKEFKITGEVMNAVKKPLPNAEVLISSQKPAFITTTLTDANGRYLFDHLPTIDSGSFFIQGNRSKGKKMSFGDITVDKFKGPPIPNTLREPVLPWYVNTDTSQLNYVKRQAALANQGDPDFTGNVLREVEIRKKKVIKNSIMLRPDYVFDEQDVKESATQDLYQLLKQKVPGFRVFQDWKRHGGKAVMMVGDFIVPPLNFLADGYWPFPLHRDDPYSADEFIDEIRKYPTGTVKSVQVALDKFHEIASILVYTSSGVSWFNNFKVGTVSYRPLPILYPQQFYRPKYTAANSKSQNLDYRSTLHWEPALTTDQNGKAKVSFYTSDIKSTYTVTIAGIDGNGKIGDGTFKINGINTDKPDVAKTEQITTPKKAAIQTPATTGADIKLIRNPLDSLNKRMPAEKVYLQLDKPYYNIGDTIWFKSYVVNGADLKPSKKSGFLYVELDNDSTELIRRVAVRIKNGVGRGQIPITKILFQEGGYTLRAYTRWMQNFDDDSYYHHRFYIGLPTQTSWLVNARYNLKDTAGQHRLQVDLNLNKIDNLQSPVALRKVDVRLYDDWHYLYRETLQTGIDGSLHFNYPLKDNTNVRTLRVQVIGLEKDDEYKRIQVPLSIDPDKNIDLQFLPEGGRLVSGLKSTIGFKAVSEDGKGITVSGGIFDSKGNKAATFETLHNGIGSFEFTPRAGETYVAKIMQPHEKQVSFPQASPAGVVMHITNPENGGDLSISLAGLNTLTDQGSYLLVGLAKNLMYYSQPVSSDQSEISVSKKMFPSGIAHFTLFRNLHPMIERAVFIDNNDKLTVKITADKDHYNKRENVGLNIEVKDAGGFPVRGDFSLAVTDDMQITPDSLSNFGPMAGLLLNSELRGHIESPGYYLNHNNKQAWQALDNLMLTQGWTSYSWQRIFAPPQPPWFEAEPDFKVTGHVYNVLESPVANVSVLLSSQKPAYVKTAVTDSKGKFAFDNLPQVDSPSFFLQALRDNGKAKKFGDVAVDRISFPFPPGNRLNPIIPWYVNTDGTMLNNIKKQLAAIPEQPFNSTGTLLKEVKIKDKKIIPGSFYPYGPGRADYIFDESDIKESGAKNLYDFLRQSIPNLRITGYSYVNWHLKVLTVPIFSFNHMYWVDPITIDGGILSIDDDVNSAEKAIEAVSKYQIDDIIGVEMAYTRRYTNGKTAAEFKRAEAVDFAKIHITTRHGEGWNKVFAPGVDTFKPVPVVTPKEFYNPKYDVKTTDKNPDYRATLLWNPDVTTDANGKAKLYFYSSDIAGSYTVKLAGIDTEGNIADATAKINNAVVGIVNASVQK